MLKIIENSSNILNKSNNNIKSYFRYTFSGRYILILNNNIELNNSELIIFDNINNITTRECLKYNVVSIRNVNFINHYNIGINKLNSYNHDISDIILIEDSKGSIKLLNISNNMMLLKNCYLLVGKIIKKVSGIRISDDILILIILTNEEIYLFSNYKYECFDYISNLIEYNESIEKMSLIKDVNNFNYYKIITPEFDNELTTFCVNSFGKIYLTCSNEIFKIQLPDNNMEKISDFEIRPFYIINNRIHSENDLLDFYITDLISYEIIINDILLEFIYIIFEDNLLNHNKKISLLKIKTDMNCNNLDNDGINYSNNSNSTHANNGINNNNNNKEFEYRMISNLNKDNCTHILSYKILNNGQLGIIWECNNQIYINIFSCFNNDQNDNLNDDNYLNDNKLKIDSKNLNNLNNFRDLTSLLYGDSPLIYINELEYDSLNKRTDEILKIHSRIFSESLKFRDVEKEELYIKEIVNSIELDDNTLNLHNIKKNKVKKKCRRFQDSTNNKNPLRNMELLIFLGLPIQYSGIIGIDNNNNNITNLSDDWYNNMSYRINTINNNLIDDHNFLEINYTCWYEGIFNYLLNSLLYIIKTPQIHLPILKKLSLLLTNSNYTKSTSLWNILNTVNNLKDIEDVDKKDIKLLYNIIDLYIKNGMFQVLIDFTGMNNNFLLILYLWSLYQYDEILLYFENLINNDNNNNNKYILDIFKLKNDDRLLNILLNLCLNINNQKLSLFISSNIIILKSIMSILIYLIENLNDNKDIDKLLIIKFYNFIRSLIDWSDFYESLFLIISRNKLENCEDTNENLINIDEQMALIALNNINDLDLLEKKIGENDINLVELDFKVLLTISFLLESYNNKYDLKEQDLSSYELLEIKNNKNLKNKINKFLMDSYPQLGSEYLLTNLNLFSKNFNLLI